MKAINTNIELLITRDGYIDPEYARKQQLQRIGNLVTTAHQNVTGAVGSFLGNIVHNVGTEISLAIADQREGTSLRAEMHDQLRQERIESVRERFRLV